MNSRFVDYAAPQQVTLADESAFRRTLVVTHSASTNAGAIPVQLTESVEGVRQVDLVSWAVTGVGLSGGVPAQEYLSIDLGGLFPGAVGASGEPNGLKIFPIAAADRAVYQNFRLLATDTPTSLPKVQTWRIQRPDGTAAQIGDYSRIMLHFDLWVDKTYL